jgi:hypothetical protein
MMSTEDTSTATAAASDVNPYWAAAEARLRDAGVAQAKPEPQSYQNYSYPAAPLYSSYYPSPYVSVPMPSIADGAYSWPTQMPQYIPPPPRPYQQPRPLHQQQLQRPQRLDGGNRVPFNYASQQPAQQRPRFNMTFQRPQQGNVSRFATSNPLASAAENDVLGNPNGGFFLRGRHPPALKNYVSLALAHPKTSDERIKCENYLYSKIEPLMLSGAVFHVQWASEPLPHEKNYELTTSWTPASKLKPNTTSTSLSSGSNRRETRKQQESVSRPERMSGPDIYLVPPSRSSFSATSPVIQRGKKNKKRKNNNPFGSRFDDEDDMFDAKRVKGEKFGTNHTENWLEDWIVSRKNRSSLTKSLNIMSLKERPYRRKAILPAFDGSRLARSLPKVLSNLEQGMIDDFFNRNEGRFDPGDCEEIVGTCYEQEKKFFRLTKKPDASEIRPPTVLRKHFNHLQTIAKNPTKYKYVCDQLRAIRQDLTVQKIRDDFTISVYEFHARLTLENKDLCEFNQCQTQLRHLYDDLPGSKNEYEFTAYRLLYYILTEDDQDILSLLNDLDAKARRSPSIALAIKVHDAYLKGHHIKLFKLYKNTPRMCGNVMDLFLDRERRRFIKIVQKSYHPFIEVSVLSNWFQFSSEKEFAEYMKAQGIEMLVGGKTEPKRWAIKA